MHKLVRNWGTLVEESKLQDDLLALVKAVAYNYTRIYGSKSQKYGREG
jgi:hypothetical protein